MAATRSRRDSLATAKVTPQARDWSSIILSGLLGARFLVPTESAIEGDALWLVVTTLLFACAQYALRWRSGEGFRRLDRVDYAMLALVGAQLLSAGAILTGTGQKRASLNVAWEWLASLVVWFEIRRSIERNRSDVLFRMVLSLSVVLAGYGIWQNQVWFQENATLVNEWESLNNRGDSLTAEEINRVHELERSLGRDFQSATGGAKRMLIDRIRSSTEPIGCFALANTLAGVLIVGLWMVPACGLGQRVSGTESLTSPRRSNVWGQRFLVAACIAPLAICLVMTKSRTALVGVLVAAGCVWFIRQTGRWLRRGTIAVVTVGLSGAALLIVALMTGLIDAEVISEAPKSLRYRLEYWASTAQVILEHIWLGCGPGNFRQNYLHYKLPGASEEILDPHNLLLDVWANAGIIAWAGLMALLIWGIRAGWKVVTSVSAAQTIDPEVSDQPTSWTNGALAALAGPALVTLQQLTFGAGIEERMWCFLLAAPLLGGWLTSRSSPVTYHSAVWGAWLTLSIHLCGAGGIAMPTIFQLWSLLLAYLVTSGPRIPVAPRSEVADQTHRRWGANTSLVLSLSALIAVVACIRTSVVPIAMCQANIADAIATMSRSGRSDRAEQQLIAAADADPLSPEPWGLLMQLRAKSGDDAALEQATMAGREAIARNPENPSIYELLGQIWASVEPATPESQSASIDWYTEAVHRYPNSSRIGAALAVALHDNGRWSDAVRRSKQAILLDDRNIAAGHVDKVLPEELRKRLEQIASNTDASARSSP